MKIGSHVGMSGKEMLLGSAKEAVSYGADTFMFYTGAPQNTRRKEIEELKKESKTALGIAAAATGKTMEELEKDTKEDIVAAEEDKEEQETEAEAAEESAPETAYKTADTPEAVTSADEAQDEIEAAKAQLAAAQKKIEALEAQIKAEKA